MHNPHFHSIHPTAAITRRKLPAIDGMNVFIVSDLFTAIRVTLP